jgi:hypothetical protein
MSDVKESVGSRSRPIWTLGGAALAVALAVAAPAWAQSAEDLNSAELGRLDAAPSLEPVPMAVAPQPTAPTALSAPIYAAQATAYPTDIDCNNPYYASYCLAYAAYGYDYYPYPYDYYGYAYPGDVAFGFGFFAGHRFRNFHHFAFAHGIGFHGRGFHGGGFHGGGFHGGGGGHR